ncbi:MAG: DUF1223 domain-containing protein [Pseudomonadota bacterium]
MARVFLTIATIGLLSFGLPQRAMAYEPVAVELFTSQGCSSCFKATKMVGDLARRQDVVLLSWHVDYWNRLETRNGPWIDPYSDASHTERQRTYNKAIRHKATVYTPQMVIGGAHSAVGSNREAVETLIATAREAAQPAPIEFTHKDDGYEIRLGALDGAAEAFIIDFLPGMPTTIRGGENAGRTFSNHHVVTGVRALGAVEPYGSLKTTAPANGHGCALLIQRPAQGEIIAAQYCPR